MIGVAKDVVAIALWLVAGSAFICGFVWLATLPIRLLVRWSERRACQHGNHEWIEAWSYLPLNTGGRAVCRCSRCGAAR